MNRFDISNNENGEFVFSIGNRKLNSEVLDTKRSRIVKEYAFIASEVQDVIIWIKKVKHLEIQRANLPSEEPSQEQQAILNDTKSYFTSACITYFKFFTKCHGLSITPLKTSKIFTPEQIEIHEKVGEFRHKLIAHVDHTPLLNYKLFAITDPEHKLNPSIMPMISPATHFSGDLLDGFIELTERLFQYSDQNYKSSGMALMDTIFNNTSPLK